MGPEALAEYMLSKSGGSASLIHISGCTPGNHNALCFGAYSKQATMVEGRHVYQSADGSLSVWWAASGVDDEMGNPTPGSWYCGPTEAVGSRSGYLKVTENTDIPEEITKKWQVFFDGALHEAPEVSVLTATQHATLLLANLTGAARTVAVQGRTSEGLDCFSAFGFSKLTQALATPAVAEIVNDRYTYRSEDGTIALWHVTAPPTWVIGGGGDVGGRSGFMIVEDAALLPERIEAIWKVFEDGNWNEHPGLKLMGQEDVMAA